MKLGITTKLNLAFGAMVVLMLTLAAATIFEMYGLNTQLNHIVDVTAKKDRLAAHLSRTVVEINRAEKNLLLAPEASQRRDLLESIAKLERELVQDVRQLRRLVRGENERRLTDFERKWAAYAPLQGVILQSGESGTAAGQVAALAALKQGRAIVDDSERLLREIVAASAAELDQEKAASDASFRLQLSIIITLVLVSLLCGVSIAFFLARGIRRSMLSALTSVSGVSAGSEQLSASAQDISQAASEQAAAVEEISSTLEEMSATIKQNSDNAGKTEDLARQVTADARTGGEHVAKTVAAMSQIAERIAIVQEIARQTNLLALNASIEAARAGAHGRGFAVVASEVQKLAEKSRAAAAEINELSEGSVATAEKAGGLIRQLIPNIERTAALVAEISAASVEQKNGADQAYRAVEQFSSVVQENSSSAEELASTSEELSAQAAELENIVHVLMYGARRADGGSQESGRLRPQAGVQHRAEIRKRSQGNGHYKVAATTREAGPGKEQVASHSNNGGGFEYRLIGESDELDREFERMS